ncbi:MAG: plasmid replication initiator TrfA [Pseudomonadota bacterium]|nr:plasmid replication initiator TrfA [Pseudomonadota bacterium]
MCGRARCTWRGWPRWATESSSPKKSFLRLIGRGGEGGVNIGKSDRDWLKNALARLSANTVEIKQGPYAYAGSLVDEYFRDEDSGRYVLVLNPRMKVMFGREGWTQIDWSLREALRGHPLAQWLHGFYSTHACPFPLKVETLHKLCGSATGEQTLTDAEKNKAILGWRDDSLIPALNVLMAACLQVGQAFSWEITHGDLVNVSRDPSQSQRKHLQGKPGKPFSDGK